MAEDPSRAPRTDSPNPAVEPIETDVIVIGLGPGGESVATSLADAGLEVVAIERELVGGECPYWGCIPSKMLIRAANLLAEARRAPELAGATTVHGDFTHVAHRIRTEATDNWNDEVAAERLRSHGVRLVRGSGRLTGPRQVEVDGAAYSARRGVVLNTGTSPIIPPIEGLADTPYWTNREILEAASLPRSLVVIGGGAIGLELAQAFRRFGSDVTVLEAGDRILGPEEPEVSDLLSTVLRDEGLDVRTGVTIESVTHDGERFEISLGADRADGHLSAAHVLVATGRRSRLADLGLETVGLDPGQRHLTTDEHQVAADGLWAIGDVTGKGAFTHVSMYQAAVATRSILGQDGPGADYRALPRVTFTDPEVGAVGLTEAQARDQGIAIRTGVTDLSASTRGFIHAAGNEGLIKLIEDTGRGVLVGATAAGPSGGEVLGALAVAVRAEVPVETLRHSLYAYPTFHRAIETAVADLGVSDSGA